MEMKLKFLDLTIYKHVSRLLTYTIYKPKDSKQYLIFSSHHPHHTNVAIPYNLARRIIMYLCVWIWYQNT